MKHLTMPDYARRPIHCTPLARKRAQGFTLVELMIAMVIGLMLIGGMATVFQGNRRSAELNSAISNIQENARYVLDSLQHEARMAGFQGCVNIRDTRANILSLNAPTTNLYLSAITGSRVDSATTWTPAPPPTFVIPTAVTPVVGSDVLSLQFGNPDTYPILAMAAVDSSIVLARTNETIEPNDHVIVSNCQVADLIQLSAVNNETLQHQPSHNVTASVSARYGEGGSANLPQVMKFEASVYFTADTGRINESGDSIISLYRQTLPFSSPPQEIVEGVEHFRINYGVRTSEAGNLQWFSADEIVAAAGDFGTVESIQIGLLLSSYERITSSDDNKGYLVAGEVILPESHADAVSGKTHPGDRRFRLAFNSTVSVRNRR